MVGDQREKELMPEMVLMGDMREEDFCRANEMAISKEYIGLLEHEILD